MAASSGKPVVVRWLAAFAATRRREDIGRLLEAAEWEIGRRERDVAAEPLWRGYSILAARGVGRVGLFYAADAVGRVRTADCWSVPSRGGPRLTLHHSVPRRAWRDWDAFARVWAARRPDYHAEAWLRLGARPVGVALADGADAVAKEAAAAIAAAHGLPVLRAAPIPEDMMSW